MMRQLLDGPYLYSTGREGRYLHVTELTIKDKSQQVTNVSFLEGNMKYTKRKLDRLQDSDPEKPLEEIYAGQAQVLEKIEESRRSIVHTEERLKSAVNTLIFENIPMDSLIVDDDSMLSFVNETLSKCGELKNR